MTIGEMIEWIDSASYEDLLRKWRFEKPDSPWFQGEVGDYFNDVMSRRTSRLSHEELVRISKKIGWKGVS